MSDDANLSRQPLVVLPTVDPDAELKAAAALALEASKSTNEPAKPAPAQPLTHLEKKLLEGKVIKAVRSIYDPEIPINIYELGLIYEINVADDASVKVKMTLTAPACPVAGSLPGEVEKQIEAIPEVRSADVELVWEPAWSKDRMSEEARMVLNL